MWLLIRFVWFLTQDEKDFRDKLSPIYVALTFTLDPAAPADSHGLRPILNYQTSNVIERKVLWRAPHFTRLVPRASNRPWSGVIRGGVIYSGVVLQNSQHVVLAFFSLSFSEPMIRAKVATCNPRLHRLLSSGERVSLFFAAYLLFSSLPGRRPRCLESSSGMRASCVEERISLFLQDSQSHVSRAGLVRQLEKLRLVGV